MKAITTIFIVLVVLLGCAQEVPQESAAQSASENYQQEQPVQQEHVPSQPVEQTQQPSEQTDKEDTQVLSESTQEESDEESASPEEPAQTQTQTSRCKDSDVTVEFPDGMNFNVAGNITVNGKPIINGKDYCPNLKTISEWYCSPEDIARVKTTECPAATTCQKGVCA